MLTALRDAGALLLSYSGFPSGRGAQQDFMPADRAQFTAAVKKLNLKLSQKKTRFLLEGDDKVGALTGGLSKLAKAKINVTALDAVAAGEGRFGVIFWVGKGTRCRQGGEGARGNVREWWRPTEEFAFRPSPIFYKLDDGRLRHGIIRPDVSGYHAAVSMSGNRMDEVVRTSGLTKAARYSMFALI
jgi:hypothetical protein